MNWRDFFYFSKGERRALIVLLCLITISWIWLLWSDKKQASPTETMHLQQSKTENRVIIGNNPPKPLGDSVQQKTPVSTPLSTVSPKSSKTRPTFRGKRTKPTSFPRTEKFPRGTLVELNMADTTTLKKVPGIGPVFANRIVKYRNLLGGFYAVSQLREVYGIDEETIKANKEKIFNRFGINRFKDVKIADLSTGMKQKVSLAISLCNNPEIIIFDEPTNGLDIVATKDVEDYLISLKGENKIILISTHIFSIIEKLCDEVAVILHGEKVLEGNLKELTKEKSLSNIFFELYREEE